MSLTISSADGAPMCRPAAATTTAVVAPKPQTPSAPPDHVAAQPNRMPTLLTIGAVTAAQLVPGVVEAEGLSGIAATVGIGVRAAIANPLASAAFGATSAALGHYALSLAHDATAGDAPVKAIGDFGHSLDAAIRGNLGIVPSGAR